jgi:hypothetical protein
MGSRCLVPRRAAKTMIRMAAATPAAVAAATVAFARRELLGV